LLLAATLLIALAQGGVSHAADPVSIVFDTDLGSDVDDALTLATLHALESRGECDLLAVIVSKDHRLAAAFCEAINRFYGRGEIPIGLVQGGATPDAGKFLLLSEQKVGDHLRYPNRFATDIAPPAAVDVLRCSRRWSSPAPRNSAVRKREPSAQDRAPSKSPPASRS